MEATYIEKGGERERERERLLSPERERERYSGSNAPVILRLYSFKLGKLYGNNNILLVSLPTITISNSFNINGSSFPINYA